ncbi:efflux RND transporter periplasmic adaptor subunit [Marinihelvus fidelis]|uniref:Efflux RND transporter periplasmic adaptor subunit n=1 Tax=Marinihelvus fidelis TaxID=2613842 RepID=A0A5N0T821_9GAMM|nr:efflux RND transporter periplasmic adaptor subunit [Marinihelvus fidelis]KAA9130911.1 efflux RND transporter periplasmic adaptor subunit [Marinihelvus fidelis]
MRRVITLVILAPLTALLMACGEEAAPPQAPPPAVQTVTIAPEQVATVFEYVARTRAQEDAQIRARISGTIIERNFEEGQAVNEGDLLFRIDPRPYQAALNSAQATLARAESAAQVAERNLERGLQLVDSGFISKAEMDQLEGERDSTRAALEEARAVVQKAEIDLGFTEIQAPFSGTAGRSELSIGDLVNPTSDALVTLVQLDPMLVDFDVTEQALADAFKVNQERQARGEPPVRYTPELKLPNGEIFPEEGTINYADNRVNPGTGTVTVTAGFPNPRGILLPGQFVRVELQRGDPTPGLLVPQPAVLTDMQGQYVFVVDDSDTVVRKNVSLGQRDGTRLVVESGLEEGDRVIVYGIQKVRVGMQVTATDIEAQP